MRIFINLEVWIYFGIFQVINYLKHKVKLINNSNNKKPVIFITVIAFAMILLIIQFYIIL